MDLSVLPAFFIAVVLISASPGPAVALILRRAALRGLGRTVPTVLGLELGLYIWALLAAAGFAALVATSEIAYLILRIVGAVVLIMLGIRAWLAVFRDHAATQTGQCPDTASDLYPQSQRRWWAALGEGTAVQLANPKAAIFMIAFYPQFVPADQPLFATTAVLALAQVLIETTLYLALAAAVSRAGTWFRRPRIRRWLEGVSGAVLIGLGLRVATTTP